MAKHSTLTAELSLGDTLELHITGIAHGGVSIARHNNRVIFVEGAIPGEHVRARIMSPPKKSFARATITEVLTASNDRQEHVWEEASIRRAPEHRAGGAEFGHIVLSRQRALKTEVLAESLQRFGAITHGRALEGVLRQGVEAVPGENETGGISYRTRVRLHVDPDTGAVGPYASRSRRVIPVSSLPLATPSANALAPLHENMRGAYTIDLVAPSADDPRMLVTAPGAKNGQTTRVGADDIVYETVEGHEFLVRAGGFWQVHRLAPVTLFAAVRDCVTDLLTQGVFDETAANLDLYGGAGLLTVAVAEAAGPALKILTVEADPAASGDASENLAGFRGAFAYNSRVEQYLSQLLSAPAMVRERYRLGTVVLDPPRSGAGGEVTTQLVRLSPAAIIYVACDPVALARDTKTLCGSGYDLTFVRAFDFFPHTHHFETVAVFQRTGL